MSTTKEERLAVGKALLDKSLSTVDCMRKYGISPACVANWQRQYEISAGLESPKAKSFPFSAITKGSIAPRISSGSFRYRKAMSQWR